MTKPHDFTLFPNLSPEIRMQIWRYALAIPMLYAVFEELEPEEKITIRPLGPTTLAVGQTCFEARRLFKENHRQIGFLQSCGVRYFWVNTSTVIFLGDAIGVEEVLDRFDYVDIYALRSLTNLAFGYTGIDEMTGAGLELAKRCPAITNIVVDVDAEEPVEEGNEDLYIQPCLWPGNQLDTWHHDGAIMLLGELEHCFHLPRPRLHFVSKWDYSAGLSPWMIKSHKKEAKAK